MAAKYRDKRTLITTVRGQYLSFATFPTPLLSHYPLPLMTFLLVTAPKKFTIVFFLYVNAMPLNKATALYTVHTAYIL